MRLDVDEFPLIWLRDHHESDHDQSHASELDRLTRVLDRDEPFVLVASRIPTLADLADDAPEDRRARALTFKARRAQMIRLCAGIILVGTPAEMPLVVRKAMAGLAGAMGLEMLFAADEAAARRLGLARIARARPAAAVP